MSSAPITDRLETDYDAAVARLAAEGFDPRFGARPVKRVIQREVQDRLADLILAGDLRPDNTVVLDVDENGFGMEVSAALQATN